MARMKQWTSDIVEEMVKMNYEEGKTHKEIGEIIGKTALQVRQKLYHMRKNGQLEDYEDSGAVMARPRQSGKTTKLIVLSSQDRGTIIVDTQQKKDYLKEKARLIGIDIPEPLTVRELVDGKYDRKEISEFYIDDVESILRRFTGGIPIKKVTLTCEEE